MYHSFQAFSHYYVNALNSDALVYILYIFIMYLPSYQAHQHVEVLCNQHHFIIALTLYVYLP